MAKEVQAVRLKIKTSRDPQVSLSRPLTRIHLLYGRDRPPQRRRTSSSATTRSIANGQGGSRGTLKRQAATASRFRRGISDPAATLSSRWTVQSKSATVSLRCSSRFGARAQDLSEIIGRRSSRHSARSQEHRLAFTLAPGNGNSTPTNVRFTLVNVRRALNDYALYAGQRLERIHTRISFARRG